MLLKRKYYFKIFLIIFLIFFSRIIYAHNQFNGGCNNHCYGNKNKNEHIEPEINKDIKNNLNSCLRKSLCRG